MEAREGRQLLEDGGDNRLDEDGGVVSTEMVGTVVSSGAPAYL